MSTAREREMTSAAGPFRILHINSARTWRGGEQQTLWLCRGLQRRGHQIFLACPPDSPLMERALTAGLFVDPVTMRGEWDLMAVRKLLRLMRHHDIQMVHFHTAHAHTLGLMAAQWAGVDKSFLTRRVDFHIHRHPLNRWKYGSALTAVLAISEGIRQVLLEDGLPPEQVVTVPSGIDLERIRSVEEPTLLRSELGIPGDCLIVGIVAALAPHKDHRTFLQAAALVKKNVPRMRFLIVGEGPLKKDLMSLTRRLGLSGEVVFTGFRQDALRITKLVDIFVLSSCLEGMGTALLDAMALQKPVVATRVGGIPEIVVHGENGLLVPPRDPLSLADALLRLAADAGLRREMGSRGGCRAGEFSIEKTVQATESVYVQRFREATFHNT